jgi:hypothetical protein
MVFGDHYRTLARHVFQGMIELRSLKQQPAQITVGDGSLKLALTADEQKDAKSALIQ